MLAEGNSLTIVHQGAIKNIHKNLLNNDGASLSEEVRGVKEIAVVGALQETIEGTRTSTVSGQCKFQADNITMNAFGGHTLNAGEENVLISGKSQYNYALAVLENIVAGGKVSAILAGGLIQNIAAGASVENVLGGAKTINVAAGAYSVVVGAGAINMTT